MIRRVQSRLRAGRADDSGNAIVEFVLLAVVLMIPLVYVILAVFQAQRTAFAAAEAARQAGRAYVTAGGADEGQARAAYAANLAVSDQGLPPLPAAAMTIAVPQGFCGGGSVTVTIATQADLPIVGRALTFPVEAQHTETIDEFQGLPRCAAG